MYVDTEKEGENFRRKTIKTAATEQLDLKEKVKNNFIAGNRILC